MTGGSCRCGEVYLPEAIVSARIGGTHTTIHTRESCRIDSPANGWGTPLGQLVDPDCRDGKCGSCIGGPCGCSCHLHDLTDGAA